MILNIVYQPKFLLGTNLWEDTFRAAFSDRAFCNSGNVLYFHCLYLATEHLIDG